MSQSHINPTYKRISKMAMKGGASKFVTIVVLLALASSPASAYDPSPLQDFCVALDDPKLGGVYSSNFMLSNSLLPNFMLIQNQNYSFFSAKMNIPLEYKFVEYFT